MRNKTAGTLSILTLLVPIWVAPSVTYADPTTAWDVTNSNDGFTNTYVISRDSEDADTDDYGNPITHTIEIQCTKKSLALLIYSSAPGIYPSTDLNNEGIGQFKIDSGKISNFSYVAMKDNSGVSLIYPKLITAAILKAKKTFALKVNSDIQNSTVGNFAIANIKKYVARFKSLGCSLG